MPITGLSEPTVYYVRAYAINTYGTTAYGAQTDFTTSYTPVNNELIINPSTADSYIVSGSPNSNYGSDANLDVSAAIASKRRAILKFDFSALPVGAVITFATLSLYLYGVSNQAQGRTYWAYEVTQEGWTEAGVTWNKYDGTNLWTAAGSDFTTTDGASLTMPADGNWCDWDVLALCQHFLTAHSKIANFLIKDGAENDTKTGRFYSREEATQTTRRPKLTLGYLFNNFNYIMIF
jgi:hypothetical protein